MARTKNNKNKPPILEDFAQKVLAQNEGAQYEINPAGQLSLSDAISQLIAPYVKPARDYQAFHTLVAFACLAWNASILPVEQREAQLKKAIKTVSSPKGSELELLGFVRELIRRKEQTFPGITRRIVEYKVTEQDHDFHISIASTRE